MPTIFCPKCLAHVATGPDRRCPSCAKRRPCDICGQEAYLQMFFAAARKVSPGLSSVTLTDQVFRGACCPDCFEQIGKRQRQSMWNAFGNLLMMMSILPAALLAGWASVSLWGKSEAMVLPMFVAAFGPFILYRLYVHRRVRRNLEGILETRQFRAARRHMVAVFDRSTGRGEPMVFPFTTYDTPSKALPLPKTRVTD